ncbi:MAG: zinc ribbon domain-containing protein [Thermomicrobiales bacterium]
MPELMALTCPVCGAPLSPGDTHCAFCGSAIFIKADAPQLNLKNLNQTVIQEHIADFRARIRKDRYDVEAHYGLGMAYYSLGLGDEAIDELTHAAKLMPENADIQTQLAVVLHQAVLAGKPAAEGPMQERLRKALRLDPANFEANLLQADILQRRGDHTQALRILDVLAPTDAARTNAKRAVSLEAMGRDALVRGDADAFAHAVGQLRGIDDERTRDLVLLSLRQHRDDLGSAIIVGPDGSGVTMTEDLGDKVASIGKTILVAAATIIVGLLVLMILAVILPTDADGTVTTASAVIFLIAGLAYLASPFLAAYLYRRRVRTRPLTWDTNAGTRITREDLLAGKASTADLIAVERMVSATVQDRREMQSSSTPSARPVAQAAGHWFDSNQ